MWSRWAPLAEVDGSTGWRVSVVAIAATRATRTGSRWLAGARWVAAGIFLSFGVTKFSNHAAELASFRHYPLPAPGFFVYLAGVLEIGGGLLLAAGLLTRLAALALAADMIGAVVVSGLARWEVISLTLAPLLLAAMIILIRFGAGGWSADAWLAARLRGAGPILPGAPHRPGTTR
jgi:putative oxidoreductase